MKKGLKTNILAVAVGLCFTTGLFSADYSFKKGDLSVDANTYVINILASKDLDGDKKSELIVKLNTGEFGIGFTTPASSRLAKFVPIIVKGQAITDIAIGDIYNDRTNALAIVAGKNVYIRKYLSGNDTFQQVGVIDLYKEKEYNLDKEENQKLTRVNTEKDLNGKCVAIGDVDADMKNEVIVTKNDAWLFARSPTFIVQVFKFDQNANTFKSIFLSDENLGDGMENITVDRVNNFNMFLVGNRLFALKLGRFGFVHNGISGIGKIGDSKVVAFCGIDSRKEKDKTIGIIQVHQQGQFRDDLTPDRFKNQGTLQIMELKKKGKYPPEFVTTAVEDFQSLAYADFDGDGKMDLIANCKEGFTVVKEGRFTAIKPGIDPVEALKIFAKGKYDNWEYKVGKLFQKEDFDAERVKKVVDSEEQEKLKWTNEEKEFKLGDIAYLQKKDEEAITHYKACINLAVIPATLPESESSPVVPSGEVSPKADSVLAPKSLVTPDVSPLVIPEGVSRGSIAFKDNVWSKYAHLRLADLYYKLKNKPEAEKVLFSLIANYPDFENIGRAYLKLGYICQDQKRYKEAKDHYLKVKEAMKPKERPKDLEFRLGETATLSGDYDTALPVLLSIEKEWWEVTEKEMDYIVQYYIAFCYDKKNNGDEAYKFYKRYVGNTLREAPNRGEAKQRFRQLADIKDPNRIREILNKMADCKDTITYLGEDFDTKGDWVGLYGKDGHVLSAMLAFGDYVGGSSVPISYCSREESKPPRIKKDDKNSLIYSIDVADRNERLRYWLSNTEPNNIVGLYNPSMNTNVTASWDDFGEDRKRKQTGPDIVLEVDIPEGVHVLSLYFSWTKRRHILTVFSEGKKLDERGIGDFSGGVYYRYIVFGAKNLTFRIDKCESLNTTMSGLFIDKCKTDFKDSQNNTLFGVNLEKYKSLCMYEEAAEAISERLNVAKPTTLKQISEIQQEIFDNAESISDQVLWSNSCYAYLSGSSQGELIIPFVLDMCKTIEFDSKYEERIRFKTIERFLNLALKGSDIYSDAIMKLYNDIERGEYKGIYLDVIKKYNNKRAFTSDEYLKLIKYHYVVNYHCKNTIVNLYNELIQILEEGEEFDKVNYEKFKYLYIRWRSEGRAFGEGIVSKIKNIKIKSDIQEYLNRLKNDQTEN